MDYPDTIVKQLFGEALELPPEQRAAFLDRTCQGRSELRRQVEAIACGKRAAQWHAERLSLEFGGRVSRRATSRAES